MSKAAELDIRSARRFVELLARTPPRLRWPAVPPILDRDPYLSAWLNVEAALGDVPDSERQEIAAVTAELDRAIAAIPMDAVLTEAARRAVRALLVRRRVAPPESVEFVYEPFETMVPLRELER